MSTTLRRYWLKMLRTGGVTHFQATSSFGLPYICHVGDFAGEAPFYSLRHSVKEIALMASWCADIEVPVIFDIGANNGYICTQLAQLLSRQRPRIFAFEPVPSTFTQLKLSVEILKLEDAVLPICCAITDKAGICSLAFNPRESLFAQIKGEESNPRVGRYTTLAPALTIDEVVASTNVIPTLLKVDVEGFEPRVVRGAARLLNGPTPPGILLEWNPMAMSEVRTSPQDLLSSTSGFDFYYVDDFEGQRRPFGDKVPDLAKIDWVCNIFAIPASSARWSSTIARARELLAGS